VPASRGIVPEGGLLPDLLSAAVTALRLVLQAEQVPCLPK